jgi:predicted AAA+ superfamily ATPase
LPLNFEEFLLFKKEDNLYKNYKNLIKLKWDKLFNSLKDYYSLLYEFMIFGWYPAVVLEENIVEKQNILWDIFDLFIKKDLWEYLNIDKVKIVKDILKYISINNWWKIKFQNIAEITNSSIHTIKNYIEILKELFIFIELKPYFTNKNLELVKIPKIYFIDNWVRNYFIKNFIELSLRQDKWELFEWFIIWEFIKSWIDFESIKYWNDKNKREVDIIIDNISEIIPYEIKFKNQIKSTDLIWLKAFKKEYNKKWNLINLDINSKTDEFNFILPFNLK